MPVHGIPQLVLFDASQKLLAEIRHPKSLDEYAFQFFNTEKFLSRYHALDTLLNCNDDSLKSYIIRAALKDKFWYFRQMAVNQVEELGDEYRDDFNDLILDIARYEPKSTVKADALHILRSLTGDKYVDVYNKLLNPL